MITTGELVGGPLDGQLIVIDGQIDVFHVIAMPKVDLYGKADKKVPLTRFQYIRRWTETPEGEISPTNKFDYKPEP